MEAISNYLNRAQQIISNALAVCAENASVSNTRIENRIPPGNLGADAPGGATENRIPPGNLGADAPGGGTNENRIPPGNVGADAPGLPPEIVNPGSEHIPDTFPLQTWALSADVSARYNAVLDLGVAAEFELVQLSDGNFELRVASGPTGGFELPLEQLGIDVGVTGGTVNGFTLQLSPDELALLSETLPIPEDALPYGTDPSNATLGLHNIGGISTSSNLSAAVENIDVPLSTDVVDRLTNFEIPDNVSIEGEVGSGFEVRRGNNGAWEVVRTIDVSGSFDLQIDSESPGGVLGSVFDTVTPIDIDNITTEGSKVDLNYELVYNTESNEFYTVITQETTSIEGSGSQLGVDVPVLDEVVGTPNHSALEGTEGTFNTTTVQTIIAADGTVISEQTSSSQGTFDNGQSDLVVSGSEINATYEGHTIPENQSGD